MGGEKRHATEAELQDIEFMLGKRSVAPSSQRVGAWEQRRTDCKSMRGLWAIVGYSKSIKKAKDTVDKKGAVKLESYLSKEIAAEQLSNHILHEQGYPGEGVSMALHACGPSPGIWLDFLEGERLLSDAVPDFDSVDDKQGWAQSVMLALGFSEATIPSALEHFDFDLSLPLTFLLHGFQIMPAICMSAR